MNKTASFLSHTFINGFLLGLFLIILSVPIAFSLIFLSSKDTSSAFKVTPSVDDYGGYLSFGKVAGSQAEEITVNYTAFPDFEAFYDGVFVVENTQKTAQTFLIKEPDKFGVRLFFGQIGADTGPTEATLNLGEKAIINLAADPVPGAQPTTETLTFTLQSFPEE
jgi:hypothetical protein